jgi:hypothetical protein
MPVPDAAGQAQACQRHPAFSNNREKPVQVPGLGTFAFQLIGGRGWGCPTGLDVFFLPEGAAEPSCGRMRFHAAIGPDYRVTWNPGGNTLDAGGQDGALEEMALEAAAGLVDTLHLRSESSWAFHVVDAATTEIRTTQKVLGDMAGSVRHLAGVLARRPNSVDEPEEVMRTLVHKQSRLRTAEERMSPRLDTLRAMVAACDDWSRKRHTGLCGSIRDIILRALDADPAPVLAAPAFAR